MKLIKNLPNYIDSFSDEQINNIFGGKYLYIADTHMESNDFRTHHVVFCNGGGHDVEGYAFLDIKPNTHAGVFEKYYREWGSDPKLRNLVEQMRNSLDPSQHDIAEEMEQLFKTKNNIGDPHENADFIDTDIIDENDNDIEEGFYVFGYHIIYEITADEYEVIKNRIIAAQSMTVTKEKLHIID